MFIMVAIYSIDGIARAMVGMDHRALAEIIDPIIIYQFFIMAAFVAIAPEEDGRMIGIPFDHFLDQRGTGLCTVSLLPAGQFVEHIKTQRIAIIKEGLVRWVVGTPHRIHVHFLN